MDNNLTEPVDLQAPKTEAKLKNKWGWGWIIIVLLCITGNNNEYMGYGFYNTIITILAFLFAIPCYFTLRNKFLLRIRGSLTRSFAAGLITFILMLILSSFIQDEMYYRTKGKLLERLYAYDERQEFITGFRSKKQNELFKKLINNPSTNEEAVYNLEVMNEAMPISCSLDSINILSLDLKKAEIEDAVRYNSSITRGLPFSISALDSAVSLAKYLLKTDQYMLEYFRKVQLASVYSSSNRDQLIEEYATASIKHINLSKKFNELNDKLLIKHYLRK